MANFIGWLIATILAIFAYSFFAYFSGTLGFAVSIIILVGAAALLVILDHLKIGRLIFSSRMLVLPFALFGAVLVLSPAIFEKSFCEIQRKSGRAVDLFSEAISPQMIQVSLERECLSGGGMTWAMAQPSGLIRIGLGVGCLFLFGFSFTGSRKINTAKPSKPKTQRTQPQEWTHWLHERLSESPPPEATWHTQTEAILQRAAEYNGGFIDRATAQRLLTYPAFSRTSQRDLFSKAQKLGIDVEKK